MVLTVLHMTEPNSRDALIAILQLAYSGERAAGYAYRGHWHSVSDPDERREIEKIENEEWHHRALVSEMLRSLDAEPDGYREVRALFIGKTLAFGCHIVGWLLPMFGAGKLESGNVREYEVAAKHAHDCGRADLVDCLLEMAEVEWEHECYFRAKVLSHRWGKKLPLWPEVAPKESIRQNFGRHLEVSLEQVTSLPA
jgi:rubrerythrin